MANYLTKPVQVSTLERIGLESVHAYVIDLAYKAFKCGHLNGLVKVIGERVGIANGTTIFDKSPVKLDTAYKLPPQRVNAAVTMRMDSIYIARGYNDAKHMAYDRDNEPDTVKQPDNRPIMDSIYKEMKKDGLVGPMKITGRNGKPLTPELQEKYKNAVGPLGWGVKDNKFYVEGRELSPELEKKYSAIYKNYKPRRSVPISPLHMQRSMYMSNHLVLQMLRDGLTKDGEALNFILNDKMFYINGVQQPPAVFQKYYDEFVKPMPRGKMQWAWR
ncbi:MAG: hypothetical protein V4619_15955 [Bacteroidota bacterium]